MAKTDESWYSTSLDVARIKQILGQALAGAEVDPLNFGPLDEAAAFGILAEKGPSFLSGGRASAQILVHEKGGHRRVQFIALGTSMGESLSTAWQVRGESFGTRASVGRQQVKLGKSKKMVAECVSALQSADPQFKQVG